MKSPSPLLRNFNEQNQAYSFINFIQNPYSALNIEMNQSLSWTIGFNDECSDVLNPSVNVTVTLPFLEKNNPEPLKINRRYFDHYFQRFTNWFNSIKIHAKQELTKMMNHLIANFAHMRIITFVSPE